jgi:hypothetical protein
MVSKSQDIQAINEAYMNVYESKKKDQDVDGDNDFADVMIARMIAAGVPREEAIRRVKDKSYNEEYELDEASPSNPKLYKGRHGQSVKEYQKGRSDAGKRTSGDEKTGPRYYNLGHSRVDPDAPTEPGARPKNTPGLSSTERNYLRYRRSSRNIRKVGGERGLPSPENIKADFELWIGELLDEGYDLSDYTWDEMYEIYEGNLTEAVLGRDSEARRMRPASERTKTALTSSQRASRVAAERRAEKKQRELEALANRVIAQETGTAGRGGTGRAVKPREEPSSDKPTPAADTRKLPKGQKTDTAAAKAAKIIAALRREDEETHKKGAEVLKQVQKEELEIYEELVNYLLEYSYADDINEACAIIDNSSDAWLEQILEEIGLID